MSDPSKLETASVEKAVIDSPQEGNEEVVSTKEVTSFTTISSLGDLREKAPEVYHQMTIGIAMNICHEMREHAGRLKEMMRESRRAT